MAVQFVRWSARGTAGRSIARGGRLGFEPMALTASAQRVSKADLIKTLCRHGSMATQTDVDAFVEASDALCKGVERLDVADVVALLGALDAGDDHPEVRWTVLHVIEHQGAGPYLVGTLEALHDNPRSEWAGLLVTRLANAPSMWPGIALVLAAASKEVRERGVRAVRTLAVHLDQDAGPNDLERARRIAGLADALVGEG
jgi:hypothetical protein